MTPQSLNFKKGIDISIPLCYNKDTKRKEKTKMKRCPVNDESCPYFKVFYTNHDGIREADYCCELPHPEEDCDDYMYYYGEDEIGG